MTSVTDKLDRQALQSVDAVLVMNSWMRDYAHRVTSPRSPLIRFVPPGIDTERFRPRPTRDLRSSPYVLCVGRLNDERKNVGLLLRAFAALPPTLRVTTRLVLSGSSGPPATFWNAVSAFGLRDRVVFVAAPTTTELISLYQDASLFALSSREEGFGIVIIEAMACGIPVVSTRSGGPDGNIVDGHDGFLVSLDDEHTFARRLATLLGDEQRNMAMGLAARRSAVTKFDHRIAGRALLDVHEALLATLPQAREPEGTPTSSQR